MVVHAFNPRNGEEYKVEYKTGGDRSQAQSHSKEAGLLFWSEVEVRVSGWLLCFSDLQAGPQYLSLGFYYSCCTQ